MAHDKCGHGKKWREPCQECEKVNRDEKLKWLIKDIENSVRWYEQGPFIPNEAKVIANLYNAIGRLAAIVADNAKAAQREVG